MTAAVLTPEITPALAPDHISRLDIAPVSIHLGAEVRGVRLSGSLNPDTFASIKQALLKHKVLFFRGQQHLDNAEHEAFGRLWGTPVPHPTVPAPDGTTLLELDSEHGGRANSWHTDVTFEAEYPQAAILRAVVIPPVGGDTVWANTALAYQNLPAGLKSLADTLWALHGNDYDYAASRPAEAADEGIKRYREVFTSRLIEAEHPVVRIHPETGERTLVLGHFVKRLLGYSTQDSTALFNLLQGHILRPENTVRWRWQQGDVAIWDNRATQHYALNDYGTQKRVVRRVTIAGDAPVGVDGRRSVSRSR
ncbi:MAG: TauD/TfdA family dioxygenase [Pusillimonas sp.]